MRNPFKKKQDPLFMHVRLNDEDTARCGASMIRNLELANAPAVVPACNRCLAVTFNEMNAMSDLLNRIGADIDGTYQSLRGDRR